MNPFQLVSLRLRYLAACFALLLAAATAPATTVIPPEFPELVRQADYVVRAVVKSVTSELREKQGNRRIYTRVELEVREVITGNPPQPLVLVMLGGKVGDEELIVHGVPRFNAGEEHIFFVHGNGTQFCPLVAIMHGSYAIKRATDTGREYVACSNGRPLFDEHEVTQPMEESIAARAAQAARPVAEALSPAEFTRRIRDQHDKNENRPQLEK